jgi:hypothetical protein
MNRRRIVVGLCTLCALCFSALASQGAAAATKGTTAFTCKETGEGGFTDAHCKTTGSGKFLHVAIQQDTQTELTISNETTGGEREPLKLKATVGGVVFELQASTINGKAWMENKISESGEHYINGIDMIPISGVAVTKPAGKGCKVYDSGGKEVEGATGSILTEKGKEGELFVRFLKGTTEGQGDALKFEPTEGEVVASFVIDECTGGPAFTALNKAYAVTGSVRGTPEGATVRFSHTSITEQGTLFLNGSIKTAIEGTLTFSGRASSGEPYKPISPTTVET